MHDQQITIEHGASGEDAYHYGIIARALEIIDSAEAPLPLETLAGRLGMSPAHFQRVFSRWVGVSPKRYQQYLALDHARRLLAARHSVLEASLASGLSGSGRLHDLFLRWEAMSPGEYARAGAGLTIRHGWADTRFGPALGMATDRGLCGLAFAGATPRDAAYEDLAARWPRADFRADEAALAPMIAAAVGGSSPRDGELQLHLIGTPMQIKVWEALLHVPQGHVTTYSDLAKAAGAPRAVRAVGSAVGRNPLAFVIPCHRALRKSGALGGYHWGLPVKRAMLAWESARADAGLPLSGHLASRGGMPRPDGRPAKR
jgi:AraC family transcriptional regulator, regulatory protein of adaptative response / methylated-DNA-[protein]-cysteine methyltransferase